MPIWAAVISVILMAITGVAFLRMFYFQAKVILTFPVLKMEQLERLRIGPWSEKETVLRSKWARSILHVLVAFVFLAVWVFFVQLFGLNGPVECLTNAKASGFSRANCPPIL